jgi:hypothetical protein
MNYRRRRTAFGRTYRKEIARHRFSLEIAITLWSILQE